MCWGCGRCYPTISSPLAYYARAAAIAVASLAALRRIALAPFGFALRAARDSGLRADAIGIDTQARAGLRSAWVLLRRNRRCIARISQRRGVSDDDVDSGIGRRADHGAARRIQTLIGPIVGALAYHGLSTELTRLTDHWRLFLGLAIVILAVVFPDGIVGLHVGACKTMSLLQVEQLQRSFGGVRAVDGVSFIRRSRQIAALIGPNGAGKSTLFNLIDGQLDSSGRSSVVQR